MPRITMKEPLVEIDGDEMTRVIWSLIREKLLDPFVDLKLEKYDLGLARREATGDRVTVEAAEAIRRHGVGVKCATITANAERVEEYRLSRTWPSPNATIRALLDGTVFRAPITVPNITCFVPGWKKPIIIARHAYGDVYKGVEFRVEEAGTAELSFTGRDGRTSRKTVHRFDGPGVLLAMHNLDRSVESFARACFNFALDRRLDLWFSTKDTISRTYDHRFKDIFRETYEASYREKFEQAGIEYFYTLIDDAVARVMRSGGGFLWACKNYDGDVMSDAISAAFGSLAMMTSVLVSPGGHYEFEAAHGTVQRHYYRHLSGEKTSTNPVATIFAWTGALRKRGELDGLPELASFAGRLEKACLATIEEGVMTADLLPLSTAPGKRAVDTGGFLEAVASRMTS